MPINNEWYIELINELERDNAERYLNDINALNEDGETLVYRMARSGCVNLINGLVELGGDINLPNKHGNTPVAIAVLKHHEDTVAKLVELGANLYTPDKNGWTIAHLAASDGDADALEILSKYNLKMDAVESVLGATPVYIAAHYNHENALSCLIRQRVNIEIPDKHGRTPLHIAAENGFVAIMDHLLIRATKAHLEASDDNGSTAVVIAAENSHLEAIELLNEEYDANLNASTNSGKTALYIAARKGHTNIVRYLLQQIDIKLIPTYYSAKALEKFEGEDENKRIKIAKLIDAKLSAGFNIDCIPVFAYEIAEICGRDEVIRVFQEVPLTITMYPSSDPYIADKKIISISSQYALLKLSFLLGYYLKDPDVRKESETFGTCNGVMVKWIEESLLGEDEERAFNHYLNRIHRDVFLFKKITLAKEKKKQQKELTSDEKELLDIDDLCKHIGGYQSPKEHAGPHLDQRDIEGLSRLVGSEKIKARGGLSIAYSEPGIYTEREMVEYFDRLGRIIENAGHPPQSVIGIALTSLNHAIGLTYKVNVGWKFLDINDWPTKKPGTTQEIAWQIFFGFKKNEESIYAAFNTNVITTADDRNLQQLVKQLHLFKKSHVITREIAERFGDTNLAFLATMDGDLTSMLKLAEHKMDFNKPTRGLSPLFVAAMCGNAHIIPILANHGVNIDALEDGETVAIVAVKHNHASVIVALAALGANFAMQAKGGDTIVHYAALSGHAHFFPLFKKYGVNINTLSGGGMTAAHIAAIRGDLKLILKLARLHTNFDIPNPDGATAMCFAAIDGYIDIVKALTEHGADYNASQPIFYAAREGHFDIVHYLLQQSNIQIKALISNTTYLRSVASKHEPQVIAKMEQLIHTKLQNGEDEEQISVKPDEIAYIMGHDEIVRIINEYKIQQGELPPKIVVPTKIDTLTAENTSCFFNNPGKLASDLAPVNVDVDPPKYAAESQLQFS